jgi:hypothetical protein
MKRVTIELSHAEAAAFASAVSTLVGFSRGVRLERHDDDEPAWYAMPVAIEAAEMLAHRIRHATRLGDE